MKRVLVMVLMLSVANASAALAGETLLETAARVADHIAAADAIRPAEASTSRPNSPVRAESRRADARPAFLQGQPGPAGAGLRPRVKWILGLGAAAALAGIMLTIDSRVEDNTPSTKGERQTTPF